MPHAATDTVYRFSSLAQYFKSLAMLIGGGASGVAAWSMSDGGAQFTIVLALLAVLLVGVGATSCIAMLMGLPKLVLSDEKISYRTLSRDHIAAWSSLGAPDHANNQITLKVIGPGVDLMTKKARQLAIPTDILKGAPEDLLQDIQARRAAAQPKP